AEDHAAVGLDVGAAGEAFESLLGVQGDLEVESLAGDFGWGDARGDGVFFLAARDAEAGEGEEAEGQEGERLCEASHWSSSGVKVIGEGGMVDGLRRDLNSAAERGSRRGRTPDQ